MSVGAEHLSVALPVTGVETCFFLFVGLSESSFALAAVIQHNRSWYLKS